MPLLTALKGAENTLVGIKLSKATLANSPTPVSHFNCGLIFSLVL
jgi:hypothetical protein